MIPAVLAVLLALTTAVAAASPRDAELSGLSCDACHTSGAALNGIGSAWAAQSNRLRQVRQWPLPRYLAVKWTTLSAGLKNWNRC